MSATIPSQWNVLHPLTLVSQRATKRDSAHQRHARSVKSSSCAEDGFFSQAHSVSAHGLQPERVVLQRYCSVLSAIRTATRCSSAFQFDVLPEPRAFEACCSRLLSSKRPSPALDARFHLDPPGSTSRSTASTRSCQAHRAVIFAPHSPRLSGLHWPSRLRPCVLSCIAVSPKSSKTFSLSSSWRFVVRSLTLLCVSTFFNEHRTACTAS